MDWLKAISLAYALLLGTGLALADTGAGPGAAPEAMHPSAPAGAPLRPMARAETLPRTRWTRQPGGALWTRAALVALKTHASALPQSVPADIAQWCPAYPGADAAQRRAFWAGFLSALAKHESTYREGAVGGGERWYGLLQILPATARGYGCAAGSRAALLRGGANLSCAARIMAVTVPRDGVIAAKDARWRGVAADWSPMRNEAKRMEMAGWLRRQSYCVPVSSVRPRARPGG